MARSKKTEAAINDALSLDIATDSVGLGIDIVDIGRVRRIMERTPSFTHKMFSEGECVYCESKADPAMHFAARFAAKEAVVKALGCGFAEGIHPRDIEVINADSGRPMLNLYGRAKEISRSLDIEDIPISISHTKNDAIACAIAISKKTAAEEERVDPKKRLAEQFREAKTLLDEI